MDISEYPLIAVTEVFGLPSVDNDQGVDYDGVVLGPTEEILERKLNEATDYYGWSKDTQIEHPIHVFTWHEGGDAYGHRLTEKYEGAKLMGNGHHRLAWQAYVQGALFVHYSPDYYKSGD